MNIAKYSYRALAACKLLALVVVLSLAPALVSGQSLFPLFGNGAGAISQVASVRVSQDWFVTAVINSTGNLEIISWYANLSANQLQRQGTWYGKAASAVAISSPFELNAGISGVFTTASINANGNLDIAYWQLGLSGEIGLASEVTGATASLVSIASVYNQNGNQQFVTAVRDGLSNNLVVSLWYIDSTGHIRLKGNGSAGNVYAVSVACLHDVDSDVITAVENSSGDLELIQWFYSESGPAITRGLTTYTSTPAYDVAVAPGVFNNNTGYVNAFYTVGLNPWTGVISASAWNQLLGLEASTIGATSSQVALASYKTAAITVATPQNGGGDYFIQVFDQNNANSFGAVAGAYGDYAISYSANLVDTNSPDFTTFAVAYRNTYGDLQIEVWDYEPACAPNCP